MDDLIFVKEKEKWRLYFTEKEKETGCNTIAFLFEKIWYCLDYFEFEIKKGKIKEAVGYGDKYINDIKCGEGQLKCVFKNEIDFEDVKRKRITAKDFLELTEVFQELDGEKRKIEGWQKIFFRIYLCDGLDSNQLI